MSEFDVLNNHQFISLKTYRKNGNAVATPVWFVREDGKLYVMTLPESGKAKRIRNNNQVEVAPCDGRGNLLGVDYIPAQVRILPEGEESKHADQLFLRRYGWQKRLFGLYHMLTRKKLIYLEITPRQS
ncbi:MAG: PPOX class F420-dependent oxidoreductase [Phototrophicales bacterium]